MTDNERNMTTAAINLLSNTAKDLYEGTLSLYHENIKANTPDKDYHDLDKLLVETLLGTAEIARREANRRNSIIRLPHADGG